MRPEVGGSRSESSENLRRGSLKGSLGGRSPEEFRDVQRSLVCHGSSVGEAQKQGQDTGDQRESIREFRESLEKITEGFAESEEFRGVQRCLMCHVSSVEEVQKQGQDNGSHRMHTLPSLVSIHLH